MDNRRKNAKHKPQRLVWTKTSPKRHKPLHKPNAVTAIIGPSGCGKSTFIRVLNRMHELIPNAKLTGQVLLDGEDIYAKEVDPVMIRRRVGMVFQKPNPFPTMSIYDNVAAGLTIDWSQERQKPRRSRQTQSRAGNALGRSQR